MATKKAKKIEPWKKVLYVISAILLAACLVIDGWYLYILIAAPDKLINNTFEIGLQETVDGNQTVFMEVQYFSNANKNGHEGFEIKFNRLLDETKTEFYSQSLQFVTNTVDESLAWTYLADEKSASKVASTSKYAGLSGEEYYDVFGSYRNESTSSMYNYAKVGASDAVLSPDPIDNDSTFLVTLGSDLYRLMFRGQDTKANDQPLYTEFEGVTSLFFGKLKYNNYYSYNDVYFLSYLMYNSVKELQPGTDNTVLFPFGDMFKFYKYNGSSYEEVADDRDMEKLIIAIETYCAVDITVSADGMRSSADSMFGMMHGSDAYSIDDDYSSGDYFYGRPVIEVDIYDFDYVNIEGDQYALRLKSDFVEYYSQFANQIYLAVYIDAVELKSSYGIEYAGFTQDSGLDNFNVIKTNVNIGEVS